MKISDTVESVKKYSMSPIDDVMYVYDVIIWPENTIMINGILERNQVNKADDFFLLFDFLKSC